MTEGTTQVVQETTQEAQSDISTKLQDAIWGDGVPTQTQEPVVEATQQQTEATTQVKSQEPEDEILDPNDWLKREFEVDSPDTLKQYLQEYKTLKETKPQETKWANDDSKKLYEAIASGDRNQVLDILNKQSKLEQLASAELNTSNAADVVKSYLQFKYPDLTQDEINYKFNKQYSISSKPTQRDDELDDEYNMRLSAWESDKRDKEMELMIDAKQYRPELVKFKNDLVLPEIKQNNQQPTQQISQEELAEIEKAKDGFVKNTEAFLGTFNGISTSVKDKDVDYNVSYLVSQEDKALMSQFAKEFAESNFDANQLFAKDWLNEDGSLNVKQIIEDKMWLANKDRIIQKIAMESANQRLELYLKEKKNIKLDIGDKGKDFGVVNQKSQSEVLQERFWG